MRKVILDLAVSLDGFIEGSNGEIDWCIMDDDMNFDDFLSSIDTIFYGRVSYNSWGNYQPDNNADTSEKTFWQNMQQETADKLIHIKFHLPEAPRAVIFPRKTHFPVFHFQNPTVGNGNTEHITRKVFQYFIRISHGFLYIHHPVFFV